jgi:hypothetical protein
VNESISQLDGTDDVPDMPLCRRLGVRGKSFLQKPKPSAGSCISAVDVSVLASNSEMFSNGVTELKTNEFSLSTGPEKETCVKQVTVDGRNAVIAGGMQTHHEDDSMRNCLLSLSEDGEGCVSEESMEAALETGPVTANTKCDDCVGTRDMKTDAEIWPVESCGLSVVARNVSGPVDAGSTRTLLEDGPSSVTCVSHENGIEAEPAVDLNSFVAVPEDCAEPALSGVTKSECLQMLSEPLVEVSESVTAGILLDPSIRHGLSRVSQDSGVRVMGCVGSEPADLKDERTNSGHAVNVKVCITGEKSASERGADLVDSAALSIQTGNALSELLRPSSNTPTFTESQVCAITIKDDKCTGLSDGRYLKKLARELRRKRSKKLSLSYRRKAASLMSEERNKRVTGNVA